MAEGGQENRSSEDLLDEPSQSRIEEFRGKGQVAQSRELSGLIGLVACVCAVYAFGNTMGHDILNYMREMFQVDHTAKVNLTSATVIGQTLAKTLRVLAAVGLPVSLAGFIFGIAGSFIQVGSIFTFDPLSPSFDKIDPIAGAKRLVSMKHFWDSLRLIVKVVIACFVVYGVIKTQILGSPTQLLKDPVQLFESFSHAGKSVFISLILVFGTFAGLDYWMQRKDWLKQVRMTKQEAKEDSKEKEGNPQVKARIRTIQREMSRKRMMSAVKTADVIVTNPTHIAIAIQYDKNNMMAPRVVAKGADLIAQRIRQIAAEAGVPLVENVPLARTLYKSVKINQYVPRALYQAVAEVLAYVYKLRNRTF